MLTPAPRGITLAAFMVEYGCGPREAQEIMQQLGLPDQGTAKEKAYRAATELSIPVLLNGPSLDSGMVNSIESSAAAIIEPVPGTAEAQGLTLEVATKRMDTPQGHAVLSVAALTAEEAKQLISAGAPMTSLSMSDELKVRESGTEA